MAAVIKPFAHQKKSIAKSDKTPVIFDCSDPGTGKTYVRIKVFEKRRLKQKSKCAIVFAPKTLLRTVWAADFKKFAPGLKVAVVTAGTREEFNVDADVYITNIDAVKWVAKQPKTFLDKFDELIIDESTAYKHPTSQRSKAIAKISKRFKYRACMTGTPNSRSIVDVWHQVYILDEGKRLGPSYYAFRNTVCQPIQVGRGPNAVRWEDKDGAEEAVFNLLEDIVIRHKFEDCVDIPANHRYELEYELTSQQRKHYDTMEQAQMMLLTKKTPANATARLLGQQPKNLTVISAVNAAAVTTKLLQVASGAVYSSPDKYHLIDTGRYDMVLDLVEQRDHSLAFFLWKHQRDLLVQQADKRGISFCVLDGDTKDDERVELEREYQAGKYQVMFAHPKSAGHGLTLTRGTTTIWTSPTYDLEWFAQGSKRQHRMGQTKKTETITILAPNTIETRVYEILMGKNARMKNLLDLFATAGE